jgi:hypothetical protein
MEVSGQIHILTTLTLGKSPRYQLDRRPGGPRANQDAVAMRTRTACFPAPFLQCNLYSSPTFRRGHKDIHREHGNVVGLLLFS